MYKFNELPIIPGIRDEIGGPLRNTMGTYIGNSDPIGNSLNQLPRPELISPLLRLDSGMPAISGAIVRNVCGNPVGEIGPLGGIAPLPWR